MIFCPGCRRCVTSDPTQPEESACARRLFLKGVLPAHKPTVTITLQTAPAEVRVSAARTQRIVV